MWRFVCALAGRVVAVFTRLVLNRLFRNYLKEKLGRVKVGILEGRIDFSHIILKQEVVSSYIPLVKRCQVSRLEVSFVRKPLGFVLRLNGLVVETVEQNERNQTISTDDKVKKPKKSHRAALGTWLSKRMWAEVILTESQLIVDGDDGNEKLRSVCEMARTRIGNGQTCKLTFERLRLMNFPNDLVELILDRGYIQAVEDFRVMHLVIDQDAARLQLKNTYDDPPFLFYIASLRLDIWLRDLAFELAVAAVSTANDESSTCRLSTGRLRLRLNLQLKELFFETPDLASIRINIKDAPLLRRWYLDFFSRDKRKNSIEHVAEEETVLPTFDNVVIKCPRLEAQIELDESDELSIALLEPRFEHTSFFLTKAIANLGGEVDLQISGRVKAQRQHLELDNFFLGLDDYNRIDDLVDRSRKLVSILQLVLRPEEEEEEETNTVSIANTTTQLPPTPFTVRCGKAKISIADDSTTTTLSEVEYSFDGETDVLLATALEIMVNGVFEMRTRRATQTAVVDDESEAANAERGREAALELSRKRHGGGAMAAALRRASALVKRQSVFNELDAAIDPTSPHTTNSASSLGELRIYFALYDSVLEYEAAEESMTAKLSLGFARLATTLSESSAVCSTRVRDLELDLAKCGLDASIATLDVLDAVAKLDQRTSSSLTIELGTVRTYACHDSLKALFDLADDASQRLGCTQDTTTLDSRLDEKDRMNTAVNSHPEFFVHPTELRSSVGAEKSTSWEEEDVETTAGSKILVVEDYVGSVDTVRRRGNENTLVVENKMSALPGSEMELTESSLRNLDAMEDEEDDDDQTVSSFVDDEDFSEPKAAWYGGEFDASTIVKDHVQRPLRIQSEEDGFFQPTDRFHFELKSQSLICRFFAGSEWQQSTGARQTSSTENGATSRQLAELLLDADSAENTEKINSGSALRRGRLVERLCELSLNGGRVRFAHPSELHAFRLEIRLEDFGVSENVSAPEEAPKLAIAHWLSRRHPRLSSEPMLLLEASGLDDHGIGTTTHVKLKVVPLRCRLDAHFVAFVDAFAGALENLVEHTQELGSDDDSICDPKEYIFGDRELQGDPSSSSSSGDESHRNMNDGRREAVWVDSGAPGVVKSKEPTSSAAHTNIPPPSTSVGGDDRHLATLQVAAWKLKLDYRPRGVDASSLRRGSLSELLHLFALERVELDLRKAEASAPSLGEALDRVRLKWTEELRNEQLHRLVAGAEPLRPVANVSASALDVVAAPISESFSSTGRPLRALKQSGRVFGEVTAVETARASRKLASAIANALDQASEPTHRGIRSKYDRRRSSTGSTGRRRRWDELASRGSVDDPNLQRAKDAFLHGIDGAASACAQAIKRPSASNIAAALPVMLLQPLVGATRGLAFVLLGLEQAMDNDAHDAPLFAKRRST